ncbi:MAG: hypothetical protein AAFQ80_14995 [Cyanobacteria bacterium J06621_8]
MGSTTSMMFMAVDREHITLPIVDWMANNNIWQLFEDAHNCKSQYTLFQINERHGAHFNDIIEIRNRCNLRYLDFLDMDILEDGKGTILEDLGLISTIHSITIIFNELFNAIDNLWCLSDGHKSSKDKMKKALRKSQVYHNMDLANYEEEGLFMMLKALLLVMNDALVNDKVFIYIKYTA